MILQVELDPSSETSIHRMEKFMKSNIGILSVSHESSVFTIEYNPDEIGPRTTIDTLKGKWPELSISLVTTKNRVDSAELETKKWRNLFCFCLVLCVPIIIIAYVFPHIQAGNSTLIQFHFPVSDALNNTIIGEFTVGSLIQFILTTPIQFYVGRHLYFSAYTSLRYGKQANMDVLVMLSTSTAYFYSLISSIIAMANSYDGI
jgi:Cu+-exporting ATPase